MVFISTMYLKHSTRGTRTALRSGTLNGPYRILEIKLERVAVYSTHHPTHTHRRLAWSNDPWSYAGGSLATVRASSQAGQVKGDDSNRGDTMPLQVGDWA
jgi:hypothetical protein